MKRSRNRPGGSQWRKLAPAVLLVSLTALAAGCGPAAKVEHLVDRARAEASALRPHPDFVPTPLADVAEAPAGLTMPEGHNAAGAGPILPVTPSPTATRRVPEPTAVPPTVVSPLATPGPAQVSAGTTANRTPGASRNRAAPGLTAPQADDTAGGARARRLAASAAPPATQPPSPTPAPAYRSAQPAVALTGLTHYWQEWNNCGPATLASELSYYGTKLSQRDIAAALRPDRDDKNVNPDEMVAYVRAQGLQAITRVNGDPARLRLLLSNGIPVIVETWMEPKPNDGMGHYRLLTGYDDARGEWIAYDSYESTGVDRNRPYAGIRISYDALTNLWHVFNNAYVVVYRQEEAPVIESIVGADMDPVANWLAAEQRARATLQNNAGDAFAWFNLGSDLVGLGRYGEAAAAYDQARRLGLPWRMLWYQFGPFRAYYETGRFREMVALADATLKTVGNIEELHYWRGLALQAQGDAAGARRAWQRAAQLNPNYRAPADALAALGQ